jgi:alkaline phosphatase
MAAAVILCASLVQVDLAIGSVVIRSQNGMTFPLPETEAGEFQAFPASTLSESAVGQTPSSVILIIGDGMGVAMVSAASTLIEGPQAGLAMEMAPVVGLAKTHASNALVTDSAASASAMATGFKTNRKMISMLPDGRSARTLFEAARDRGMATGVITTSGLMDATPAAFTVHNEHRDNKEAILIDQLSSGAEVMIGAAWGFLDNLNADSPLAVALAEAKDRGLTVVTDEAGLGGAEAPFVALFPPRPGVPEAGGPELAISVGKALEQLSAAQGGFVLVVESEETDEQGHDNNVNRVVDGVRELDTALATILEFANARGDTLVLVTADHDTGAMSIVRGRTNETDAKIRWATDGHTGAWVPVFAFGPGAENFAGVFDNTEIGRRIATLLALPDFPKTEARPTP